MAKLTAAEHLKLCATAVKGFVNKLMGDFTTATVEALEEIEAAKADKTTAVTVSIPITGWVTDESVSYYPYYYDFTVSGAAAGDRASVTIAPASQRAAIDCGICPTNETMTGKIRIRTKRPPAEVIHAEYRIEKGKVN